MIIEDLDSRRSCYSSGEFIGILGAVQPVMLEHFLPALQFASERFVDFPVAMCVRIIPKPVVAMTIVHPAGMIQNRIKTNPVNRHSTRDGRLGFLADITKPAR